MVITRIPKMLIKLDHKTKDFTTSSVISIGCDFNLDIHYGDGVMTTVK